MMKPRTVVLRQLTYAATDGAMVTLALLAAYLVRFYSGTIPLHHAIPPLIWYTQPLGVIVAVYLLFFRSAGLYATRRPQRLSAEVGPILHGIVVASVLLMALTFLYRDASYSRVTVLLASGFTLGFVMAGRMTVRRAIALWLPHWQRKSRLLVLGTGPTAAYLIQRVRGQGSHELVGVVALTAAPASQEGRVAPPPPAGQKAVPALDSAPGAAAAEGQFHGLPILGHGAQLKPLLEQRMADEVVLADHDLPHEKAMELLVQCEQEMIHFRMVPDLLGLLTTHVGIPNLDGLPLLGPRDTPLSDPWNRCVKRTVDIACALLGLLMTVPLWLTIAAAIKRDSPGPVFYRQERIGQDGQVFQIMKFRTMRVGAEAATGPVWATPNDDRRTRVGQRLRRWNLDELPQLLNILKGEMSLVGPRPERPHFVRQFKQDIPRYMTRHRIRSGLTGWAQVHGLRGDTSIGERTQYDLYYLENWSLWLDAKVLWRSLTAVKNAY